MTPKPDEHPLVLIVDDDRMNIEVVSMMLEGQQVSSVSAINGRLAVDIVKARIKLVENGKAPMFKIILMDYSMPEMDGPTAVVEMWKLFRSSRMISDGGLVPFICCCTAYGEASFKKIVFDSGMDHFINKPVSHDELVRILELLK